MFRYRNAFSEYQGSTIVERNGHFEIAKPQVPRSKGDMPGDQSPQQGVRNLKANLFSGSEGRWMLDVDGCFGGWERKINVLCSLV